MAWSRRSTSVTLTFERETIGFPATTVVPPEAGDVDDVETVPPPIPTVPPPVLYEGVEMLVGIDLDGNIYRTADFQTPDGSGGPTWEQISTGIAEVLYSFVVDPFSPGYITGSGSIDGWVATEDAIYKLSNLFGTLVVDEVRTFATSAVAADFHWRSIQASFGGYFAEGVNPWLLCVSYYGDTGGHTGTWATHSLDGGTTWSTEVQISAFYNSGTRARFDPIAVYTSPRTPGLAYTAAQTETSSLPATDGYISTDWGETWTRLGSDPDLGGGAYNVQWGLWDAASSTYEALGSGLRKAANPRALEAAATLGTATADKTLIIAPHKDTKILTVQVQWTILNIEEGLSSSTAGTMTLGNNSNTSRVATSDFTSPAVPGDGSASASGGFSIEWTKGGTSDWNINSETILSSPPSSAVGCRVRASATANASGGGTPYAETDVRFSVAITYYELEDGTIIDIPDSEDGFIVPGYKHAGTIHLPWQGNTGETLAYFGNYEGLSLREFKLLRNTSGTVEDISPTVSAVAYGANRGPFSIRAYDSDRQFVLLAGIGNSTSADPADDLHSIFYSDDAGTTWTTVITPEADSNAPVGRPMFEAAFAGDSHLVHFYWGKPGWIAYSDDAGATYDDRSGDIPGTADGFIGIAGGIA
jgi:hypothetical protein